nr:tautomerase family protein [Microbacterium bovistercoris]
MPYATIHVPAGSLDAERKSALIAQVTDAIVEAEQTERIRPYIYVVIDETARDGFGLGGTPIDVTLARAAQG